MTDEIEEKYFGILDSSKNKKISNPIKVKSKSIKVKSKSMKISPIKVKSMKVKSKSMKLKSKSMKVKKLKKSINESKLETENDRNSKNKTKKNKKKIFSLKDYNSNDGFLTTVWGPTQWHMLHTISFNYPTNPTDEQKNNYRNYILSLQNVLPCGACRKNLTNNLKNYPLTMKHMKNRTTFSKYIYNLHEIVNEMLNKKSGLSYCDVRERYEHFRSRCVDKKPKVYSNFSKTLKNRSGKEEHEKGCTEPLYGEKSRCILNIVPQEQKGETFQIDEKCIKRRD